ncbi:translesion DNA synthesis-associated protein ImuA [Ferribacterium limneticum]|uniref:translesion DNA synthesis-associated protein ImuA n=1 Tax=Ferribacterium limneticum TaxID=76259 RepID=UPI001CF9EB16|nr:translesion DNA synthesis-associated protein ImuA [Ferribacterium limneticum]UCV30078.1 translesion DNA synthesis-associated protein ImuA [Ferribacterium limneticum]UCV33997.1 translesion DNA synthesis-associated protein ImuA [Ferribacterium limneticum]
MTPMPSPVALADVLARGDIWRGDTLAFLPETAIPSGHAELDAELPGGGWPRGNLTEILVDRGSVGEMSLLLPALAKLSAEGGWLALVAPPWLPHAPAWAAAGLALDRLVIVQAGKSVAWCVEQLLASGGFAGVLAWPEAGIDARALRRLQVAAEGRSVFACLWRSTAAARVPSPAPLRLMVNTVQSDGEQELSVRIIKRRGRPVSRPLALSIPRPGRSSRAVAGPALSLVAARGLAAASVA